MLNGRRYYSSQMKEWRAELLTAQLGLWIYFLRLLGAIIWSCNIKNRQSGSILVFSKYNKQVIVCFCLQTQPSLCRNISGYQANESINKKRNVFWQNTIRVLHLFF